MAKSTGPAKLWFEVFYLCMYCKTNQPWIIGAWEEKHLPLTQTCRKCKQDRAAMVGKPLLIAKKPGGEE